MLKSNSILRTRLNKEDKTKARVLCFLEVGTGQRFKLQHLQTIFKAFTINRCWKPIDRSLKNG